MTATATEYDYSTLDADAIERLPIFKKPPSYKLQDSPGNGCYGDPPGFPTHFTYSVYTQYGNTPSRGATLVIQSPRTGNFHVLETADSRGREPYSKRMTKFWKPLPLDHPRTVAWIQDTYSHFRNCYADDSRKPHESEHTVIYPVPDWSDMTENYAKGIATPENHKAYRRVVEFYPEHTPDLELISNPPTDRTGSWWDRYAERPTPENCPGSRSLRSKHPVNGSWCQVCGWSE